MLRVIVPAIATVFALTIVEIVLRLTDDTAYGDARLFVSDAARGWALRPGYRGWATGENRVWVQINSDGLRDREHSLAKPPGVVRIAVLGDSFMQGVNVPLEKTFSSYLEARLRGCAGLPHEQVEVLNFGVSGYGTAQELATYEMQASRYAPDIVLLALYTANDLYNNHPHLNPLFDGRRSIYYALHGDRLERMPPERVEEGLPLRQKVRLFVTTRLSAAALLYESWARLRAGRTSAAAAGSEDYYVPPQPGPLDEAWRLTEALVLKLRQEVQERGSEFWLVTLANTEQVTPIVSDRAAFAKAMGVDSLFYPDDRLREFAKANDIPAITLAYPLADHTAATGEHLYGGYTEDHPYGTGHWNERGNALAAHLVATRLCRGSHVWRSLLMQQEIAPAVEPRQ